MLKHPACPSDLHTRIESDLRYSRASYRVVDKKVICPIASDGTLASFKSQQEAIDWAKRNGHTAHVARVRHLNDKKKPGHWRAV
jgi:hypothetical protein